MHRKFSQYPSVFLHTGDCFVGARPTVVSTVLGSCVAVTLFSARLCMGAICHAFLPSMDPRGEARGDEPQACRFVDSALARMFLAMERLGAASRSLEIKVFGGASGYATGLVVNSSLSIGPKNVEAVDQDLARRGLTAKARDTGGAKGRKLFFLTSTGEVWVKRLGSMQVREVLPVPGKRPGEEPSGVLL